MRILTDVDYDDVVTITKKKRGLGGLPSYDCIVGNTEYETKTPGYQDLYSIIQNMSKQTAWLWWELAKNRKRFNNESCYKAETYTDKRRLTVAYAELHSLELVRRIRKQCYLISPLVFLPEQGQFQEVKDRWDSLGNKNPTIEGGN